MEDQFYAVESYNAESNSYSRHDVGPASAMEQLLSELVSKDVESGSDKVYYRVNPVTQQDKAEWDKQAEHLPEVKKTDRLFGDWVQIGVASKYLDVTFGRVFHLVTAGQLSVNQVGRNKLVSVHDVVERKIAQPSSGRPALKKPEEAEE